jgi:hypothetical protein
MAIVITQAHIDAQEVVRQKAEWHRDSMKDTMVKEHWAEAERLLKEIKQFMEEQVEQIHKA